MVVTDPYGDEGAPTAGPPPHPLPLGADALAALQVYADLLADEGVVRGLIGPREVPRLWERHLVNCLAAVELVESGSEVLDLGSGAGLPGIVWAIARPDLRVELVEPLLRRTRWLEEVVAAVGLAHARVTRARAEELRGRRSADVVTARAVAPLERLAEWGLPLVRPGGVLLALKGESAAEELKRSRIALARLGTTEAVVLQSGAGWARQPTTVVRVVAGSRRSGPGGGRPGARDPRGGRTRRR